MVLPAGQYIKHGLYGFGTITEADAERTTIDFDDYGVKKFVTSKMECELAGAAPPRRWIQLVQHSKLIQTR